MTALDSGFSHELGNHGPFPVVERRKELERQQARARRRAEKMAQPIPYENEVTSYASDDDSEDIVLTREEILAMQKYSRAKAQKAGEL